MEKEILEFTDRNDCVNIVFGNNDQFKVIKTDIVDHSRWSVAHEVIVQRISDGKYFSSSYSVGATESQDQCPYEYDDLKFIEVKPVEKVVIEYI